MTVAAHDILQETRHSSSGVGPAGLAGSIGRAIGIWRRRISERQTFAALDRRDLRDLGLSQWEVELELAKPFWRS